MNAYELADELWEKYLDNNECQHGYALSSGCPNDDCQEQALYDSATMLRQQAKRIEELEGRKGWFEVNKDGYVQHKELSNDRIREIGDACELKNNGILNWIDFARAIIKASRGEE